MFFSGYSYRLRVLIINILFQINCFSWVSAFQGLTFLVQELFADGGLCNLEL